MYCVNFWFCSKLAGFLLWREIFIITGKKKIQSSVWRVRDQLQPEKKDTVVCLLGARFWQLRPEKKKIQSSVWQVVLYVVSVFGSGRKLAVFLLWQEIFITTGKKKVQQSVWRVRDQLRLKNKRYSRLSVGCEVLAITTGKKKIQSSVWRVVL